VTLAHQENVTMPSKLPPLAVTVDIADAEFCCRELVAAYNRGERNNGSVDLSDLSDAFEAAKKAVPGAYDAITDGRGIIWTHLPSAVQQLAAVNIRLIYAHTVDGPEAFSWEEADLAFEMANLALKERGVDCSTIGLEPEVADRAADIRIF
jgi:hypothetical protein